MNNLKVISFNISVFVQKNKIGGSEKDFVEKCIKNSKTKSTKQCMYQSINFIKKNIKNTHIFSFQEVDSTSKNFNKIIKLFDLNKWDIVISDKKNGGEFGAQVATFINKKLGPIKNKFEFDIDNGRPCQIIEINNLTVINSHFPQPLIYAKKFVNIQNEDLRRRKSFNKLGKIIFSKLNKNLKKSLKNKEFKLLKSAKSKKLKSCCYLDKKATTKKPLFRGSDYILTPKNQSLQVEKLVANKSGGSDHLPVTGYLKYTNKSTNKNTNTNTNKNTNIVFCGDTNLGFNNTQGGMAKIFIDEKIGLKFTN